jgi:WD40 repeat protein
MREGGRVRLAAVLAVMVHVAAGDDGQATTATGAGPDAAGWTLDTTLAGMASVAWAPSGTQLASTSAWDDLEVKVWDAATHALLATLTGHRDGVTSVAWAPSGRQLASASNDSTVKVWDFTTHPHALLATLSGHTYAVNSVAWAPSGTQLASASGSCYGACDELLELSGTVKVWDAHTYALVATLSGHCYQVLSVAWAPNGTRLASSSCWEVRVWDAYTHTLLATLEQVLLQCFFRLFLASRVRLVRALFALHGGVWVCRIGGCRRVLPRAYNAGSVTRNSHTLGGARQLYSCSTVQLLDLDG